MNILVFVKQVPDTTEVKIDPKTNTLIREGVPSIVNPFDKHALEAALRLKDSCGAKVTVITMGPPQAKEALRECLAMGSDEAVLVSDRAFGGADTLATSYTLAATAKKLGYDIIICGKQAIDGDTAQVGPEVAEHLDIPQVTYVSNIKVIGNSVIATREMEETNEVVEAKMPVLLTVVKSINTPRYPTVKLTVKARQTEIRTLTNTDLDLNTSLIGLNGSPTQVSRIFNPPSGGPGLLIKEEPGEAVMTLIEKLKEAKVI
ncbi:MAG: electron transfer flavoprotein subunit beta/FixA family protein [Firmicutes bacterium]|nr:electron transfer flavoprotein subunit beta/FixA family protein [Bacillota bacterium]